MEEVNDGAKTQQELEAAIIAARKRVIGADVDEEVWEYATQTLIEIFEEPEHLVPVVYRFLMQIRHDTERRINSFSRQGSFVEQNLRQTDWKLERLRELLDTLAALRSKQRDRGFDSGRS